ncbi:MAG: HlyD family efflux transporter periplasmic adaptor subunit [Acidobacteria bacterium]|nr:HlyD family efflux transporter periplasmic adaptor subunit [Acidobacteriota bacterium]
MAAFPNPPERSPGPPGLQPATAPPERRNLPLYGIGLLLLAGAIWYLRPGQHQAPKTVVVPTVKAVRGSIEANRRISGSITAGRFANVNIPRLQAPETGRGMTITFLAASGSMVKKGDLLVEIDSQDAKDHLNDVEAQVDQSVLDNKKKRTVQVAQMEAMQQRVRSARADLLKAREDLKSIEVRSEISQEIMKLAVEEDQAAYSEIQAEVPLAEQELQADMNISLIATDQMTRHRDRHRHDIAKCRVVSPIDGMVVLQTTNRNGEIRQIQVGELVYPGQPVLRVVDPASMELDATMNQADAELVRLGQSATVHFDAYPDIALPGKVHAVGALAFSGRRQNNYIRNIAVRVDIDGADPRVIPDLSASADVVIAGPTEGLIVPREAVAESSGKNVVYVRQTAGFAAREVEIAGENNTQVAVSGGLHEGEEIALAPGGVIAP